MGTAFYPHRIHTILKIFLLLFLLCGLDLYAQGENLDNVLNPDGTIKTGAIGSFNTSGYKLEKGINGAPVLKKINSPNITNSTASWSSLGTGKNGVEGTVNAIAINAAGDVFVGGGFRVAGDVAASNVAKWNGSTWSALTGNGFNGVANYVLALAVIGNDVYVGGSFYTFSDGVTPAYSIAKWNQLNGWSILPTSPGNNGTGGTVNALAVSGSDLIIGGSFDNLLNSITVNNIVKFNTITGAWTPLTSGFNTGVQSSVYAIAVNGNDFYLGGYFNFAGTLSANHVIKWNNLTNEWVPLIGSTGINGVGFNYVYGIATSGSDVYIIGDFSYLGDNTTSAKRIAKWNGTDWSSLPGSVSVNGLGGYINAIAVVGSDVYVGGYFTNLGDNTTLVNHIAKWDGNSWSAVGGGTNGVSSDIKALAVYGTELYAGGYFKYTGTGLSANYVTKWNGSSWSALSGPGTNGMTDRVFAIAVKGNDVYVGGNFTLLGDGYTSANRIAKWNGSSWSALSANGISGVNDHVSSIAILGSDIFVGGSFTKLSDETTIANGMAKWNGTAWSAVTGANGINGVNGQVLTLAVSGTDLYAGGSFTQLGNKSTPASSVAKWNGTNWSSLYGNNCFGVSGIVFSLAASGSNLYVGGTFTKLDDNLTPAKNIVLWNGSSWTPLIGSTSINGVNGYVMSILVHGTDVYLGGTFAYLGDGATLARCIVKWDGIDWIPLISNGINGVGGSVNALAFSGNDLYVGGAFDLLGDIITPAGNLVKWNGTDWITFNDGSTIGISRSVNAFGINSNEGRMYIGGDFVTAGSSIAAYYIVKLADSDNPLYVNHTSFPVHSFTLSQNYPNPFNPTTTINYSTAKDGFVKLTVYDAIGRKVADLVNKFQPQGMHSLVFNGFNLGSGIYFYKLEDNGITITKKFVLLK